MVKYLDFEGLAKVARKIKDKVRTGAWIPIMAGRNSEGTIVEGAIAEGKETVTNAIYSHAEGFRSVAAGVYSHAEGNNTTASNNSSHAEGNNTKANGDCSHAEGYRAVATGNYSHAEGCDTQAISYGSHAEGYQTQASSSYSHSEGYQTKALGFCSHAEGYKIIAKGNYAHADGIYNYDSNDFIKVVGVGSSEDNRINAEVVYVKRGDNGVPDATDPKNGHTYLIGIGGYTGKAIVESMKSVQEVIGDLENGRKNVEDKVTKLANKSRPWKTAVRKAVSLGATLDNGNPVEYYSHGPKIIIPNNVEKVKIVATVHSSELNGKTVTAIARLLEIEDGTGRTVLYDNGFNMIANSDGATGRIVAFHNRDNGEIDEELGSAYECSKGGFGGDYWKRVRVTSATKINQTLYVNLDIKVYDGNEEVGLNFPVTCNPSLYIHRGKLRGYQRRIDYDRNLFPKPIYALCTHRERRGRRNSSSLRLLRKKKNQRASQQCIAESYKSTNYATSYKNRNARGDRQRSGVYLIQLFKKGVSLGIYAYKVNYNSKKGGYRTMPI